MCDPTFDRPAIIAQQIRVFAEVSIIEYANEIGQRFCSEKDFIKAVNAFTKWNEGSNGDTA